MDAIQFITFLAKLACQNISPRKLLKLGKKASVHRIKSSRSVKGLNLKREEHKSKHSIANKQSVLNKHSLLNKHSIVDGGSGDFAAKLEKKSMCHESQSKMLVFASIKKGLYFPCEVVGKARTHDKVRVYCFTFKKKYEVPKKDIITGHGNLLSMKVCYIDHGRRYIGTVYGNDSPKHNGMPTWFYIKKHKLKYFKTLSVSRVFLTRQQVERMICKSRRKSSWP